MAYFRSWAYWCQRLRDWIRITICCHRLPLRLSSSEVGRLVFGRSVEVLVSVASEIGQIGFLSRVVVDSGVEVAGPSDFGSPVGSARGFCVSGWMEALFLVLGTVGISLTSASTFRLRP